MSVHDVTAGLADGIGDSLRRPQIRKPPNTEKTWLDAKLFQASLNRVGLPRRRLETDHLELYVFRRGSLHKGGKKLPSYADLERINNGKDLHHMVPNTREPLFRTSSVKLHCDVL
jgi:hypothetical protein